MKCMHRQLKQIAPIFDRKEIKDYWECLKCGKRFESVQQATEDKEPPPAEAEEE